MNEIWLYLPTFDEKYSVSNLGRIRRNPYNFKGYRDGKLVEWHLKEKILVGEKVSTKGYLRVTLDKKQYFVHRLVAQLFVDNYENKPQVNHINGDKLDNRAENLEWVTNQENRDHAVRLNLHPNRSNGYCKVTSSDVIDIIDMCRSGFTQKEIAKKYNLVQQTISKLWLEYSNRSMKSNSGI